MDYSPLVSIIIPTYNRAKFLPVTLDSFIKQDYPKDKYEIIVVNNNSTDNTQCVIDDYCSRYSNIRTIFEKRQGVHNARNSASKTSTGEILYYTDDDMIADRNLIKNIVKAFSLDDKIACVSGRIFPKWEKMPPKWVKDLCYNYWLSLNNRKEDLIISPDDFGVFSCHQAIKKDVFLEAGGFNPENVAGVWIGDGETGLNIKIKELGYKFAYVGDSIIYHIIPQERMTQAYLNKRLRNQGACDSFTVFKNHTFNKIELCGQILKHFVKMPIIFTKYLLLAIYRQNSSWRFSIAYVHYYFERIKYDLKLVANYEWRSFVLKNNWLL